MPKATRCYIIGLAAGGLTGVSLALANRQIAGLVSSGAFFPLDLTRRDYRIKGHPFCHDFRHFGSYLPVYALALDRPLQIQMGKGDGLWAGNVNTPSKVYSGLRRSVLTEEIIGPVFILERLSEFLRNKIKFVLCNNGHERMDFEEAFRFIEEVEKSR